jgi:hypothetical protein
MATPAQPVFDRDENGPDPTQARDVRAQRRSLRSIATRTVRIEHIAGGSAQ